MFLDRLDKAILRTLQADCSISNVKLADKVGLSPPACLKRVQRLHRERVIDRQVAILNPLKLGGVLHLVVEVYMERDQKHLNDDFVRRVQQTPQVKECYQVTGEVDFVLIIDVPNMADYELLCEELLYSHANMKSFKTLISMNRVKYDTQMVVEERD
ncbi:Lrp/AsnC family transcriptional regulator [Thaumasiovibrio subtropicus]|uniref:Lrp/AsnC family transcriptional regulator n=1 Tax=Thaumasiovibrio subtropicus TaxID=1891207 RepID=UPI000B35FDE3|nr:Lrp/AsnC family transcriptional regulator [Thaumasiovibrio subtropicus]